VSIVHKVNWIMRFRGGERKGEGRKRKGEGLGKGERRKKDGRGVRKGMEGRGNITTSDISQCFVPFSISMTIFSVIITC